MNLFKEERNLYKTITKKIKTTKILHHTKKVNSDTYWNFNL